MFMFGSMNFPGVFLKGIAVVGISKDNKGNRKIPSAISKTPIILGLANEPIKFKSAFKYPSRKNADI